MLITYVKNKLVSNDKIGKKSWKLLAFIHIRRLLYLKCIFVFVDLFLIYKLVSKFIFFNFDIAKLGINRLLEIRQNVRQSYD